MDGASADVRIPTVEDDVDDDQVVDVFHVFSDTGLGEPLFDGAAHADVACCSSSDDLALDVMIQTELMIRPFDFDLSRRQLLAICVASQPTHSL